MRNDPSGSDQPTDSGSLDAIHRKARSGITVMLGRSTVMQAVSLAGGIVLARVLEPAEFGIFGIVTFVVNLLALWGDVGIAPSIIQRRQEFGESDLKTAFTLQQMMTSVAVVAVWISADAIARLYPVEERQLAWLIRVLAVNLYLQSWRSISAVVLERGMRYKPLAVVDMIENLFYQVVAVVMAWKGYGIWSLVVAVLGRGLLGAIMMFGFARWRVGFSFDWPVMKELLKYGVPFQAQRIMKQARNWVTPTLVAATIGADAVGFLNWAFKLGTKPSFVMTSNVARVSFSHLSKLQDDPRELQRVVRKYVETLAPLYMLWFAVLFTTSDRLVSFVYTDKWLPAVPVMLMYAAMTQISVYTWITSTALNARGDVSYVLRNIIYRTIIQIVLSIVLVLTIGFEGVAIAQLVATAMLIMPLYRRLDPDLFRSTILAGMWGYGALAVSLAVGWLSRMVPGPTLVELLVPAVVTTGTFLGCAMLFGPRTFVTDMRTLISRKKKRAAG